LVAVPSVPLRRRLQAAAQLIASGSPSDSPGANPMRYLTYLSVSALSVA